jgi:D-psicose/D-tagatose/L-ribulose 3-epimerase
MNVAISNIAWNADENDRIAGLMSTYNVAGVEIAPTKIWPDLSGADDESILACRQWWTARGIGIVALQSLLFGRPDLNLFGDPDVRRRMLDYLGRIIRIAARLGASVLVFGSPKNRRVGDMDPVTAREIAVEFFGQLGALAQASGVCIGLEPNPEIYGCDFIRTSQEALQLVKQVRNPGFRVHLDTAILAMSGERFAEAVEQCFDYLVHVHISEPMLGVIGEGGVDHASMARTLRSSGYRHWVSIEMRNESQTDNAGCVERALDFAVRTYASAA